MKQYYLAIDIGASSGRHILGSIENGKIVLEEVYRFENGMKKVDGHLCWDLYALFHEIEEGLKQCKAIGKIPATMGIDTWAVDYVLLDSEAHVLGETYGYRDKRTAGMDDQVYEMISPDELYARTGIQKQIFNTIYQLMAVKLQTPILMQRATDFLMLPDYFNFLLTGVKKSEYTNATSTQLVNPSGKDWDYEFIERLGYPKRMFRPLSAPGTSVGRFTQEIREAVGFDCEVVLPATHDTGSAVLAVPAKEDDFLYISSGTWSLMGIESKEANCSKKAMLANFTNEGGYEYRFRFLKNIMGLWMIQSVRHELEDGYSFAKLCELAEEARDFPSRVDVNAECFLAPDSMTDEIKSYCERSSQQVPATIGELATVIYQSLAESYADTVKEIEAITGKQYGSIYIVGGGANAEYLNQLTAEKTGKRIYAGPGEATAIGNIAAQMLADKVFKDVKAVRACIYDSFEVKEILVEKNANTV